LFIIRFCLLWSVVSLHMVGGAVLFRRLFPRESPWFGFFVPELLLVLLMNFIEHQVAIPTLKFLLPVTTVGSLWLMVSPKTRWRGLVLPTIIFLGAFTFTFFLRFLKPSIEAVRDGIYDMQFVSGFCMGSTLPVESTWIPPIPLINYYTFGHYGASVMIRLFGLDIGTGFNVAGALLAALIILLTAGVAWQISGRKLWITILSVILVAGAANGCTGYLWLAIKDIYPEDVATIHSRVEDTSLHVGLFRYLTKVYLYDRRELFAPGWWAWMGCFHSTSLGQFLTLVTTLSITEMVRKKRSDWPWICCAGSAPMMLVSSTWGFPFVTLLAITALAWCLYKKRVPLHPQGVILGLGLEAACLTPMLLYFLNTYTPIHGPADASQHTQIVEFLVQWWPVFLPWLGLLFVCRRIHPAVGIVMFVTPIAFAGVEYYNVGARFDMTGKIWGFIYCAAWAAFIPAIAASRSWVFRLLLGLIIINSALGYCFWTTYYWRSVETSDIGQLEGKGDLGSTRDDQRKPRLLNVLLPLRNQVIITGKSYWAWCESSRIANFSGNRDYITWSFTCDSDMVHNGLGEGWRREKMLNDFYDGKLDDPLLYLRQRNIAAVVIWPDDNIKDEVLVKLEKQLAPFYEYEDERDVDNHDPPNCGVFLYHPNLINELPPAVTAPPSPPPAATGATNQAPANVKAP